MRQLAAWVSVLSVTSFALFWWLTIPGSETPAPGTVASANAKNGEQVFWASGCASCHAADGAAGDDKLRLGGGHRLKTPFGTFVAPNISPDPDTGMGDWTLAEFTNAMRQGVSPQGEHYYPAFPYAAYAAITDDDLRDLYAFLQTLPSVSRPNEPHDLALAFQWRRPIGVWKKLFAAYQPVLELEDENALLVRGQYLVETLGHCGECHTPRNTLGGLQTDLWLSGGPAPTGKGRIPNITPHETGIASWSAADLVYYLESGFTPDFDSVGGTMTLVPQNMARLPKEDLE
ncbi:MAG: cytochrome c, partial [Pseudomonadota bacterium]